MNTNDYDSRDRPFFLLMSALIGMFAIRVFAQGLQALASTPLLPWFSSWQSGALPYPLLLGCQVLILVAMFLLFRWVISGRARLGQKIQLGLYVSGSIYLGVMTGRLLIGQLLFIEDPWFSAVLPTVFHIVLASFLLTLGAWSEPNATWVNKIRRYTPYLTYPIVTVISLILHRHLVIGHHSLLLSTVSPVIAALTVILILEAIMPERRQWSPTLAMLRVDTLYLLAVNNLLPKLLTAAVVALGLDAYGNTSSPFAVMFWPHHLPVPVQALIMLLIADLLRYWLHRACHAWPLLWQLHSVHHAPAKLYALNVGRFHPLEKILQYAFDSLPFLILGVGADVLAFYFVLYAINGFFQHSNIRLRYGILNYLISGPQLHRWHHSRQRKQAHCNFGNNTAIWDLVFGTWFLPEDKQVGALGVQDPDYPQGFLASIAYPLRGLVIWTKNALVHGLLYLAWLRYAPPWWLAALTPSRTQNKLLAEIVSANKNTRFGQTWNFAQHKSMKQYVTNVPIMNDCDLSRWVSEQCTTADPVLTIQKAQAYARTSGSTGTPKDVPLTRSMLKSLKQQQIACVAFQHASCPAAFSGDILAITSPAQEGVSSDGKTFGAASGHVLKNTPKLLRDKFIVPASVFSITDPALKYLLIVRLALTSDKLTYLGTANPSTLLALLETLNGSSSALVNDLALGGFHRMSELPDQLRQQLAARLKPRVETAERLRRLIDAGQSLSYADAWPTLKLVVCWHGGAAGIALKALQKQLPENCRTLELGYIASEFRGTISLGNGSGIPTLCDNVFEFITVDAWHRGERKTLPLWQLESGQLYYIIVTTRSGLYRYFMNDIVRVTGHYGLTPCLSFVQKGRGVTNITGEKLYESQVIEALEELSLQFHINPVYAVVVADPEQSRYQLYLELDDTETLPDYPLGQAFSHLLAKRNIEYQCKVESSRLKPLHVYLLRTGTAQLVKATYVRNGQREGQFKAPALSETEELPVSLDQYVDRRL